MQTYKKVFLALVVAVFIAPQIAFAAWWNPLSWNVWNVFKSMPKAQPAQIATSTVTAVADTTTKKTEVGTTQGKLKENTGFVAPKETKTAPVIASETEVKKTVAQPATQTTQSTPSAKVVLSSSLDGWGGAEDIYIYGMPKSLYAGVTAGTLYGQMFYLSQNGERKYGLDGAIDPEKPPRADGGYPAVAFFLDPNPNHSVETLVPGLYTLEYEAYSLVHVNRFELKRVSVFKTQSKVFAWPPPTCKISLQPYNSVAGQSFALSWSTDNATGAKWANGTETNTLLGLNTEPLGTSGSVTRTVNTPQKISLVMEATNSNGDINSCSRSFSVIASTTPSDH